jgi:hypothetical protein
MKKTVVTSIVAALLGASLAAGAGIGIAPKEQCTFGWPGIEFCERGDA